MRSSTSWRRVSLSTPPAASRLKLKLFLALLCVALLCLASVPSLSFRQRALGELIPTKPILETETSAAGQQEPKTPLIGQDTPFTGHQLELFKDTGALRPIPGTNLSVASATRAMRDLDCVSTQGEWLYDPTPRPIAWEPNGLAHCDLMWLRQSVASIAGPVANLATSPEEWRVRDALKYRWTVSEHCNSKWRAFDGTHFCDILEELGGPLLMVGDSTTRQMFQTLYNHLYRDSGRGTTNEDGGQGSTNGDSEKESAKTGEGGDAVHLEVGRPLMLTPDPCKQWEAKGLMLPDMLLCQAIWSCRGEGKGQPIFHVRNDKLTLQQGLPHESSWNFFLPWVDLVRHWGVKAVVLNRGVHFSNTSEFTEELEATLVALRREFPELLIVYRASIAGHPGCTNSTAALTSASVDLDGLDPEGLPFHWGHLHEQNKIARELVQRYGGVFLDIELMGTLRPDGHFGVHGGKMDCLHYCAPGPMDGWLDLMFNALRILTSKNDTWYNHR